MSFSQYTMIDFNQRPLLVFWETTIACGLACRHCRAEAIERRDPAELTTDEGKQLLQRVSDFGSPKPIVVLTGGDLLIRPDLDELIAHGRSLELRMAVSPSVTPLLDKGRMQRFIDAGIQALSISLDGANAATHDGIRMVPGTFDATLERLREAVDLGMRVQVNTAVMKSNVSEMAEIFHLIRGIGVKIWEVFFLIKTGRGAELEDIEPWQYEEVCHFLYDTSLYDMLVRTTEAPFFRRVIKERRAAGGRVPDLGGGLYAELRRQLIASEGEPASRSEAKGIVTGDGRGIVFISHKGDVYPSGYLALAVANVREKSLVDIYRDDPMFRSLRKMDGFGGRCGVCEHRDLCGGSRARAFAATGDPLAEDPACVYQPQGWVAQPV